MNYDQFSEAFQAGSDHGTGSYLYPPGFIAWLIYKEGSASDENAFLESAFIQKWKSAKYEDRTNPLLWTQEAFEAIK